MRYMILQSFLALILLTMMPAASQDSDNPAIISLIIDAQLPSSATKEQVETAEANIENIFGQINNQGLTATFFSTQDILKSRINLEITRIGYNPKFELGLSGNYSNENISTMPYADQITSLNLSKKWVEAAKICGDNEIIAFGFMPQSFAQNEDTYRALDNLGIEYSTGFQAGLLYTSGHESDVWPYLVEGHKFYAVPVSTYNLFGKKVVLQDRYFEDSGLDSSKWYEAIVGKFEEIQGRDEPLVISLDTSLSGSGEYLDALINFMKYARSKNANFVTAMQLVTLAKTGVHDVSSLAAGNISEKCTTCGTSEIKDFKIVAKIEKGKGECKTCGQSDTNSTNTTLVAASVPATD